MSLWDVLEKLGYSPTRVRWWRERWRHRWQRLGGAARTNAAHVAYRHKFCRECHALMDGEEKVCPHCGAKGPSWSGQAAGRLFGLLLPRSCPVTGALVIANTLVLMLVLLAGGVEQLLNPDSELLWRFGALVPPAVLQGQWWRMISYGFLHIGLPHFLFNMFALTQAGSLLEGEVGGRRVYVAFTLAILGGAAAEVLVHGETMLLVAGASGGLFGLIGFGAAYGHFLGGGRGRGLRAFFLQWAFYGVMFGLLMGSVSHLAHAGGFAAGACAGWLASQDPRRLRRVENLWHGAAMLLLAATLLAMVMAVIRGGVA